MAAHKRPEFREDFRTIKTIYRLENKPSANNISRQLQKREIFLKWESASVPLFSEKKKDWRQCQPNFR
jgi:hypothetical protein